VNVSERLNSFLLLNRRRWLGKAKTDDIIKKYRGEVE